MEKTLRVINGMKSKGLIRQFAVGGGIAILFYMEPVLTYDLDVFVFLPRPDSKKGSLVSLAPLYSYLHSKGYKSDREHILIEEIPVQLIPAYNPLVEEAVSKAREASYKGVKTRVIRLEYLLAILLQTGRPKDKTRIVQLLEETKMKVPLYQDILRRHGLSAKWSEFKRKHEIGR